MKWFSENRIYRFFEILGAGLLALILLVLVVIDNRFNYVYQTFCIVPNFIIVAVFVLVVLGIRWFTKKRGTEIGSGKTLLHTQLDAKQQNRLERIQFVILAVILFVIQLIVAWQIYFKTGWDCGTLVKTAQEIAFRNGDIADSAYFSMYPNNTFLVAVFVVILRITAAIGSQSDYFVLVAFGCLLVNVAGFLMTECVRKITGKQWLAMTAWVVYVILAGLSPWISIPYTDTYSIIFPILCVWFFLCKTEKNKYLMYALIGFFGTIGSFIKPTSIFVLLAFAIVEGIHFLSNILVEKKGKEEIKKLCCLLVVMVATVLLAFGLKSFVEYKMGCAPDEDKAFTPAHYLMMGLNYQSGGTYDQGDVNFSASAPNVEERNRQALQEAGNRLSQMGLKGIGIHFTRKLLTNFNDGIFSWGNEGEFYWNIPERNNPLARVLRNFYYESGSAYDIFQLVGQTAWIFVLISMVGLLKKGRKTEDMLHAILIISLIGICCFVMLFEARARYLFLYCPLFVLCGALGLERWTMGKEKQPFEKALDKS